LVQAPKHPKKVEKTSPLLFYDLPSTLFWPTGIVVIKNGLYGSSDQRDRNLHWPRFPLQPVQESPESSANRPALFWRSAIHEKFSLFGEGSETKISR
jgi:hypothetical protein